MLSDIGIFRYVFFKIIWSVLNIRIISYVDRIANRAIGRNTKTSSSFITLSSIYSRESYRRVTTRSFSSLYGVTIRSLSISNRNTAVRRSSFPTEVRTSEGERSRRSTSARDCLASRRNSHNSHWVYLFPRIRGRYQGKHRKSRNRKVAHHEDAHDRHEPAAISDVVLVDVERVGVASLYAALLGRDQGRADGDDLSRWMMLLAAHDGGDGGILEHVRRG